MKLKSIFPNARLLRLLIFLSFGLQLIVISQMYFFKADLFSEPLQVIVRLLRGTVLTFIGGAILAYPFIALIGYLNRRMPWRRHALKRFMIQFPVAVMGGLMVTPVILLPASWFFGLESDFPTLLNNAFYLVVLALFLMIVLEAGIYFDESAESQREAQKLQQDLIKEASEKARIETRMHMEEEKNRLARELMDLFPQPIFELDIEGNILFVNGSGKEFFGITMPEYTEEKISALDFMVEEDVPRVQENIKKSNQAILSTPIEYTVKRPDGTLCPVLIYGSPIIRNEKVVGRRGIIIDISERKKQELKLLKAKEELERINNTLEQRVEERTKQLTEINTQLLKVQKENLQSQFEVLKQQVNPHFLFNSLNVLTSLIKIDPDLAESFTERLSKVYRYVLENKEKDLVSLSTELEFLNAYLFLLEIRFMNKIVIDIKIDKAFYDYQILPIAIQLLIENAIKHNTFSKISPLKIELYVDRHNRLNIVNNLNTRETKFASTGVGLENIRRRYALVSDQNPEFTKTKDQFIARLPLLKSEKSETE